MHTDNAMHQDTAMQRVMLQHTGNAMHTDTANALQDVGDSWWCVIHHSECYDCTAKDLAQAYQLRTRDGDRESITVVVHAHTYTLMLYTGSWCVVVVS